MSKEYQITLPKLGESIVSATVVQWFKQEGDVVQLDEPLLEVSTDKVNSEIPSPVAGVVRKIVAACDEEVQVGELLAVVEKRGERDEVAIDIKPVQAKEPNTAVMDESKKDFFSPAVLRIASSLNVPLEQLQKIQGTGSGGRITKEDVENFASAKSNKPACPFKQAPISEKEEEERLRMTGMRKAIAENMVKSFYEAPHATLIHEIDITNTLKEIQKTKEEFQNRHGAKLTVTSFIVQALVKALKEFPLLNSSLDRDTIVLKKKINVGIAVSVDQGLVVPVVKNCHKLTLPEIARAIQEISSRARANKLQPDDVLDGTFTVTNFGMSGVSIGVPIIRYPEVAILGIGAIKKQVRVLEEDTLAIRSMMHISLTFDHRVIDGMYGCAFLSQVQKYMEGGN